MHRVILAPLLNQHERTLANCWLKCAIYMLLFFVFSNQSWKQKGEFKLKDMILKTPRLLTTKNNLVFLTETYLFREAFCLCLDGGSMSFSRTFLKTKNPGHFNPATFVGHFFTPSTLFLVYCHAICKGKTVWYIVFHS